MGRFQDSGASLRATSDVTDSTVGPFVELFVQDNGNFGLYAEDGSGNAVLGLGENPGGSNRPGDFFLDGSLVIDGTITAGEIDVPDFWATDATVKNSLTMGASGEVTNTNTNFRIDESGYWVEKVAGGIADSPASRYDVEDIGWLGGEFVAQVDGDDVRYLIIGTPDDESGYKYEVTIDSPRINLKPSIIYMTNLPTSNPGVSGQLWNDGGTVKVA
jgi:hypothetical protein